MWNAAGLTKEGANIALTLSINSGISTDSLENFAVVLKYLWDGKHTQHRKRKREQKLFFANSMSIYWKSESEKSMNLGILPSCIKQDYHS